MKGKIEKGKNLPKPLYFFFIYIIDIIIISEDLITKENVEQVYITENAKECKI